MTNFSHLPEPVGRLGGNLGDSRVLGAVDNPARTLVREMIQNSLDAHKSSSRVTVDIDVQTLADDVAANLRRTLKTKGGLTTPLPEDWRSRGPLRILVVRDRGTVGLD